MRREPPTATRRQLAAEVGFGCPVEGCGSPYLTWHHFDPPWATKQHHNPEGMVALCRDHHPEADAGAFTKPQLREFKELGRDRAQALGGQFNWMREKLLAIVGGTFYYEVPVAVRIKGINVVWFNRDDSGRLLVNLRMPTTSGEHRMLMLDNFWMTEGSDGHEILCPPSGRLVSAKYPNGDRLRIEFRDLASVEELDKRHPPPTLPVDVQRRFQSMGIAPPAMPSSHAENAKRAGIEFPVPAVEITMEIAGTGLSFGPKRTSIATNSFTGGWIVRCGVGFNIA